MFPTGLVGKNHFGARICEGWELRVTARCLAEDLGKQADSNFEDLLGIDIVKALVKDRSDKTTDRNQINPLTCGVPVWVLSRGHDHRGATFFDEEERVVWLLASGHHRSGADTDAFRHFKALDAAQNLLPAAGDYERMFDERGMRFVDALVIEAPLILKEARESKEELKVLLGGDFGARVAIEIEDPVEATTLGLMAEYLDWDHVTIVLSAFHAEGTWETVERMPSRELQEGEVAFIHVHETGD